VRSSFINSGVKNMSGGVGDDEYLVMSNLLWGADIKWKL
jgi:DNA polymerase-4